MRKLLCAGRIVLILWLFISPSFAQDNVGIGTTNPRPTALLDLFSSDQGLLIPRVDTTQMGGLTALDNGMIVYDTVVGDMYVWDGTQFISVTQGGAAASVWSQVVTDVYYNGGNVGIGSSYINPNAILTVTSNNKGILIPRVDTTQMGGMGITENGLIVYDTIVGDMFVWNGSQFISATNVSAGDTARWGVNGNDIYPLNSGNIGLGTDTPNFKLDIFGQINSRDGLYLKQYRAITNDGSGRLEFFGPLGVVEYLEFNGFNMFFQNRPMVVSDGITIGIDPGLHVLNPRADFDLRSDDKGLQLNRVDTASLSLLGSDRGMIVYDTTLNELFVWDGAAWESATEASSGDTARWGVSGNDIYSLNSGNVGIGTSTPTVGYKLDVVGGDILVNGLRIGLGTGGIGNNLAFGANALNNNPTGGLNLAIGNTALQSTTTGAGNLAIGTGALIFNTTGSSNTIVGHDAMRNPGASNQNVGLGTSVMRNGGTGNNNTAIGYSSLQNKTGNSNVALGSSSGNTLVGGNSNTFLGTGADAGIATLNNATAVGANTSVGADNSLVLGNNVAVGIGTSTPNQNADLDLGSNDRGLQLNRVDTSSLTLGLSDLGMVVYDTVIGEMFVWDGGKFSLVGGSSGENDTIPANVFTAIIDGQTATPDIARLISTNYPWINTITRNATGDFSITFLPGFFTTAPSMVSIPDVNSTGITLTVVIHSFSSTFVRILVRETSTGTLGDFNFTLVAHRQGTDYQNTLTSPPNVISYLQTDGADFYLDTGDLALGAGNVNPNAVLTLNGNNKGLQLNRVDTSSLTLGASDLGMVVYDTVLSELFIWNGTQFTQVGSQGAIDTLPANTFSAYIDGSAGAGVSLLTESYPFIQNVSFSATGRFIIDFVPGFFTVPPVVTATADWSSGGNSNNASIGVPPTISQAQVWTANQSGTPLNTDFYILVQRQGADYQNTLTAPPNLISYLQSDGADFYLDTGDLALGGPNVNPNAVLTLNGNDKGLQLNRVDTSSLTLGLSDLGMVVYDTVLSKLFIWNGAQFTQVGSQGAIDTLPANVFGAKIQNNGAASVTSQSHSFIQSVSRISLGQVLITYAPGYFTETPTVSALVDGNPNNISIVSTDQNSLTIQSMTTSATLVDRDFDLILHRQGADYQNTLTSPPNIISYLQTDGADFYLDTGDLALGGGNVNPNAVLTLNGNDKGLQLNRVDTSSLTLGLSDLGMVVYDTVLSELFIWNGTQFALVGGSSGVIDTLPQNVFGAIINNNGTATIVTSSYNFIQSINRSSTGVVDITFIPGLFTEPPAVTITCTNNSFVATVPTLSSPSMTINTVGNVSGSLGDADFSFLLQRQGVDFQNTLTAPPNVISYLQTDGADFYLDTGDLSLGGPNVNPNAVLTLNGNDKGLQLNRVDTSSLTLGLSDLGMVVYDTVLSELFIWNGTQFTLVGGIQGGLDTLPANTFSAKIANNGTATVTSESISGIIISATRTGPGIVDLVFDIGATQTPAFTTAVTGSQDGVAKILNGTPTTATIRTLSVAAGGNFDYDFDIDFHLQGNDYQATLTAPPNIVGLWESNGAAIYHDTSAVGIGTNSPNANASLTLGGNDKGLQLNRVDTSSLTLGLSDLGMMVYDSVAGKVFVWNGSAYESATEVEGDTSIWSLNGSDVYYSSGNVGIGTSSPDATYRLTAATGTGTRGGIRIDNTYTGASTQYGIFNNVVNTGTGTKIGMRTDVTGTAGDASSVYGENNIITPNGTGPAYGSSINISSAGTGFRYGYLSNLMVGATNTSAVWGIRSDIDQSGSGIVYGIYSRVIGTGTGATIGLYSTNSSPGTGDFGVYTTGEERNYFSGDVGIGTLNPLAALHISGGTIRLEDLAGNGPQMLTINNNGDVGYTSLADSIFWNDMDGTNINNKNSGFVIIGSDSVGAGKLQVVTQLNENILNGYKYQNGTAPAQIRLLKARGTESVPLAVASGDYLAAFVGAGHDGSSGGNAGRIRFRAAENWTGIAHGSDMYFQTTNIGATALSDKMILSSEGNLGIGGSPTNRLTVSGGNTLLTRGDGSNLLLTMDGQNNGIAWTMGVEDASNADFIISNNSDLSTPHLFIGGGGGSYNGNVGIGTVTPNSSYKLTLATGAAELGGLRVENTYSGASAAYGSYTNVTAVGTGQRYGAYNNVLGAAGNASDIFGSYSYVGHSGSGTSWGNFISNASSGSGVAVGQRIALGTSGTNANYGQFIYMGNTSTATNYAIYIDHPGLGSGIEYGIYSAGEDYNYFSGNVGIGINTPGYPLDVVGDINSSTGYFYGGNEILSGQSLGLYVGFNAGHTNAPNFSTHLGANAGQSSTGISNTFVGIGAGENNTSGNQNVFLGLWAGQNNNIGDNNTFLGRSSGDLNTSGVDNVFIGRDAGGVNQTGSRNTLIGRLADVSTSGLSNTTALGYSTSVSGSGGSAIGYNSSAVANSTAIGSNAIASQTNTVILGDGADLIGIGTSTPSERLDVDNGGSIEVDGEYTYETAKIRYRGVAASAFNAESGLDESSYLSPSGNYFYFNAGAAGSIGRASAQIDLPDGAVVTDMTAYLYDNDGTYAASLALLFQAYAGTTSSGTAFSVTTTVQSGAVQTLNDTGTLAIDNSANVYKLRFDGIQSNSNIRIYNVRITYTVVEAD
jgi:hypothetical protein